MKEQKEFLLKILEIIDIEKDKEAFADHFFELLLEDIIYNLLHSLPETKRDKVARKWDANTNNYAALNSILSHYIKQEIIDKVAKETANKAITYYMESMEPHLDATKREKIKKASEEFSLRG